MRFLYLLPIGVLLTALITPELAIADQPMARGIDPVSTKLAIGLDSFLALEGPIAAPSGSYQLQVSMDFVSGLIALQLGDEKVDNLMRNRFDIHLSGTWAITDNWEIGLDVPFTVYQRHGFAELEELTGLSTNTPSAAGLGDIRIVGKVQLLRQKKWLVNAAALLEARLPTGDGQSFLGERGVLLFPRIVVEREFRKRIRVGVEGGYRYRSLPGRFNNLYIGDELAASVASSVRLPSNILPQILPEWWAYGEIHMLTSARSPWNIESASLKTPLELLLGMRARVYSNLWATLGGGTGISSESHFGRNSFRLFASLQYKKMWRDRDGDGIPDEDDQCPDVPEDKDGFQDDDGCPDPDNDKDGVPDAQDKCPLVPGLASNEGCPDSDNDGIPDHLDKCPKQPGLKKYDGCPDSDDDGVPDPDDQCPQKKGPKEYDGCPDSDGDEIPDKDDSCPKEPGPAKNKGCPLQEPAVALEQGQLVLKDTIHFDTDKATIKKASFPVLDELVRILNEHPEIEKVLIEGHTDNVGSDAYNLDLSQRRAEALVKYLIEKGIAKSRLSAQGFGFHRPIAPNITAMGRALNRRVEFSISE